MPAVRIAADVRIRHLTKRYGEIEALRGISFDVAAGQIFGLLGPNGAGKTTTLECLLGLRRPDAGSVSIGGTDALANPGEVRRFVGAQLQAAALQDKITPRQALRLSAAFYTGSAAPAALLERFGLLANADTPFDALSGGLKQRVLLALAFVNQPRLVILDEPTAGLDPQARRALHGLIRQLRADGCTILLSTHQLDEAEQLCDRIGIMHAGRLVADAPPAELIARARTLPRLVWRTARPLAAADAGALAGVVSIESDGHGGCASTKDVSRTITALARHLESDGNSLVDLQIHRPSLEDVFLELTGEMWAIPPVEDDWPSDAPNRRGNA